MFGVLVYDGCVRVCVCWGWQGATAVQIRKKKKNVQLNVKSSVCAHFGLSQMAGIILLTLYYVSQAKMFFHR